jgi:Rad3-related DNA helicase
MCCLSVAGKKEQYKMNDFQNSISVPKSNYLEDYDLSDHHDLDEVIRIFCDDLESGYFLTWEAVERQEQGLTLTKKHEEALSEIICFDENEVDEIHYIDEMARPSESWHVIVNKIADNLVVKQFKTFNIHCEVTTEGWYRLAEAIEEYGDDLSLPDGISKPIHVVPEKIRHKLWIQSCFSELEGIGQDKEITLKDEEHIDRIDDFIDLLKNCKDSVEYLQLSLLKLMTILILPTEDNRILVDAIMVKLKVPSPEHMLADYL